MIRVDISFRVDPEIHFGVRVPTTGLLPFIEWPNEDDRPLAFKEYTVSRYVAPPPAKADPTLSRDENRGWRNLPEGPAPHDNNVPVARLLPRIFVQDLFDRLPTHGPVVATDLAHPAFNRVVETVKKRLAEYAKILPKNGLDTSWASLALATDLIVRSAGIAPNAAYAMVRPLAPQAMSEGALLEVLDNAAKSGLARPGHLRDEVIGEYDAEQAIYAKERARVEAERRRATELVEYDLRTEGLCELTRSTDEPPPGPGIFGERSSFGKATYFLTGGVPIGSTTVALGWQIRDCGTVQMTRKQRAEVACLPDEVIAVVRYQRQTLSGERSYAALDFQGDSRSVEGRHAWQRFQAAATDLIRALAVAPRGQAAGFLEHLLLTLLVGFGGRVSIENGIAAVQDALTSYVATVTHRRVYGVNNSVYDAPANTTWPHGLMTPAAVPAAMLGALAKGSCWLWDEAYRPPTADDARRLSLELRPDLWEATVAEATTGKDEVRTDDIYAALQAAGLVASTVPSPVQRAMVSAQLQELGFQHVEVRASGAVAKAIGAVTGKRYRAWRREAATTDNEAAFNNLEEAGAA